ncbi:hypothetical protein VK70_23550 [Paenibacillus durus ATCC 35681]|uniref:YhfC family intramembrane metalloprotease n=2 Tax=Paenibacillus durus TaxID=44251 RepID=A0A0F7CKM9_PAEDU|nr:hypothetical protein VK70_23550 [Paenibacillus durus ATCC 35681]
MSTAEKDPFAGVSERTLKYVPLYILVPVMYGAVFSTAGYAIEWAIFGLGALGWLVALFLRGPLAALVRGWPQERAKLIVGGSSGVLEEGVRLALLSLLAASFPQALSLGQGWAAIEVLLVIVNVIIIVSLIKRTDEKAMQAKQILQAQGNLQASPLWGILERIWASAFHIGAALIIARTPWSAALLIPLHSGFNLAAVRLARTAALPLVSLFAAVVGLLTLAAGLLLW